MYVDGLLAVRMSADAVTGIREGSRYTLELCGCECLKILVLCILHHARHYVLCLLGGIEARETWLESVGMMHVGICCIGSTNKCRCGDRYKRCRWLCVADEFLLGREISMMHGIGVWEMLECA